MCRQDRHRRRRQEKSSPSWRQPATATKETSPLSARATILKLKGGRTRRRRQMRVALIGEGDNFQSEGRPKLATATLQPSPMSASRYRRGRHLVPVSARATTHPSPKSASRYRRGWHFIRRRSPRTGIGEGDNWCRYGRLQQFIRRRFGDAKRAGRQGLEFSNESWWERFGIISKVLFRINEPPCYFMLQPPPPGTAPPPRHFSIIDNLNWDLLVKFLPLWHGQFDQFWQFQGQKIRFFDFLKVSFELFRCCFGNILTFKY